MENWSYQLRYIRCGKGCRTCTVGPGHGPYWYGFRREGGRVRSKYFGARPTSTFNYVPPTTETPPTNGRFVYHGKMDYRTALRIMAFDRRPNNLTLQARFRSLIMDHHPDHGGDTRVAAAIIAAYNYLKS